MSREARCAALIGGRAGLGPLAGWLEAWFAGVGLGVGATDPAGPGDGAVSGTVAGRGEIV